MTLDNTKPGLTQPWRQWYTELMKSNPEGKPIVMNDDVDAGMNPAKYGMSQHGTIALEPRTDVDFSKEKVKPSKLAK